MINILLFKYPYYYKITSDINAECSSAIGNLITNSLLVPFGISKISPSCALTIFLQKYKPNPTLLVLCKHSPQTYLSKICE